MSPGASQRQLLEAQNRGSRRGAVHISEKPSCLAKQHFETLFENVHRSYTRAPKWSAEEQNSLLRTFKDV